MDNWINISTAVVDISMQVKFDAWFDILKDFAYFQVYFNKMRCMHFVPGDG
jgi:hypothetical protein